MHGESTSQAAFVLEVVPRLELDAKLARAELRQLEQDVGHSASADGQAWLARTTALEHVWAAAKHTLRTGDTTRLAEACRAVDEWKAPACRDGDHAKAA